MGHPHLTRCDCRVAGRAALVEVRAGFPVAIVWLKLPFGYAYWRDRVRSEKLHHILSRDSAQNKSILMKVIAVHLCLATAK